MKRVLIVLVALAAVAAVLFATCSDGGLRETAPIGTVATKPAEKPVRRPRAEPSLARATAAPEPPPAKTTPATREATTTFTPPDARVAAPRHVLRGRVVNRKGAPVADAEVHLFSLWLPPDVADLGHDTSTRHADSGVTTGPDGTFALTYFEGGPRALLVTWKGQRRRQVHGLSDDREHEIVIDDEAMPVLVVHVTRASDGTPVTDASLHLLHPVTPDVPPMSSPGGWVYPDQKVTAPGTWRFLGGPAGPALLTVASPGLAPVTERRVDVTYDGPVVEVALKPGVAVRGVVVDAVTGAPIPGAHVERPQGWYAERLEADTEPDGRFVLEDAPLDQRNWYRFTASADGYAATAFLVGGLDGGSSVAETTVRLTRAATASVRCVDGAGRPVKAALVALWSDYDDSPPHGVRCLDASSAVGSTDATGRATLGGLHPGSEGLELRGSFYVDGVPVLERKFPPLRPGETRDLGDVVLAPTLTLMGTVLDADGKPAARAIVVAAPNDATDESHGAIGAAVMERGGRRAEAGPDGAFTLMGLSKGLWDVYAYADWNSPGRLEIGVDPSGGTRTLRLPRSVMLTGRVVDSKGTPVAKANVRSLRTFFSLRMEVSCQSTDAGLFGIPGYAEGTPDVEVEVRASPDAPPQTFKVRPGVTGTDLVLR